MRPAICRLKSSCVIFAVAGSRPIYWDACAFIAHFKGESDKGASALKHLSEMAADMEASKLVIATSVLTMTELLQCKFTLPQRAMILSLKSKPNLQFVEVSMRMAEHASEIRNHYVQEGRSILTPDAIHLATALSLDADTFYTFDDKLLGLGSLVIGEPLKIAKPDFAGQLPLSDETDTPIA